MSWISERDRLIADTMAFVQEVASAQPAAAAPLAAEIERAPGPLAPVKDALMELDDLRDDIRARVAAFKARQKAFQDDRETYFKSVLEKMRTPLERTDGDAG